MRCLGRQFSSSHHRDEPGNSIGFRRVWYTDFSIYAPSLKFPYFKVLSLFECAHCCGCDLRRAICPGGSWLPEFCTYSLLPSLMLSELNESKKYFRGCHRAGNRRYRLNLSSTGINDANVHSGNRRYSLSYHGYILIAMFTLAVIII